MKRISDLEYLKLPRYKRLAYKVASFFASIPGAVWGLIKKIGLAIASLFTGIGREISDIVSTFVHGSAPTKISYVVMGYGNMARGQWLRGILFLMCEIVFIG